MPIVAGLLVMAACAARWHGLPLLTYYNGYRTGTIVSSCSTSERVVALTFDDGPNPQYTPRILDILQTHGVKATFFIEGRFADAAPSLVSRELAENHVLGNHTQNHPYLERLNAQSVSEEMRDCDTVIQRITKTRSDLFRPPRGSLSNAIYTAARQQHKRIVLWSTALEHEDTPTPEQMVAHVLNTIRPGGIILMHDGGSADRERTVRALPDLIAKLQQAGYRFVTVPQLLNMRNPPSGY